MTKNQQYLNYVRHIASLFSGDQQPEDAELVLDNAFSELRGHELEVFQDRDGSAQLEVLLHHSHVSHLTALVEPLLQSANIATWFELMSNVFASHVIDAVFNQLQHCMTDYHVTDADYQSGLNLVRQIVTCMTDAEHRTVLAEHWRQLLTSKYGSYTLRHTYALVHTLLKHATKKGNRKAQTALTNQLSALLTALTWSTDSKYLIDMCHHEATAHVIELVLEIAAESGAEIQREDHVTESSYLWLVDTLLSSETSSDEEHVTEILKRMKHAVWSHVMIALIKHVTALKSNQKWNWSVLYQKYFRTRLVALCAHPVANFVVQSLIATSSTEPHWRMLFTEMEPQFSELLDGRLGVVLNLLNSSVTHVNAQSELVKAVVKVLSSLVTKDLTAKNGKEPDSNALVQETRKQIASLLLHLKNTPRHQYKKQSRDGGAGDSAAKNSFGQYSGIGCQLLSALFQLQHEVNQFVLKSFAQLGKDEHVKMCKDHQASHVIEHFLTSRHVPLNLKQNFIESLKGSFAELAQDKYGSHCVDKCYQNSELSKKEMITKELLKHERELNASFYGKHVLKNCRAEQYKKKRDVWRSKEQQNEKTRERFADILAAPTEDEHVEEKKESHVTESAAPNTESRGTKRKRKESVTGVKEESVTGVKEESAEDDIDRVFKKIKPNPRDDDEREEVTLTPVIQESVSDARLDNIVAALKKTKSKKK